MLLSICGCTHSSPLYLRRSTPLLKGVIKVVWVKWTNLSVCLLGPRLSLWDEGDAKGNARVVIHRHKDVFHLLLCGRQQQWHFSRGRTDSWGDLLHIVAPHVPAIFHQMWREPNTSAGPHLSSRTGDSNSQTSYRSLRVVNYCWPNMRSSSI